METAAVAGEGSVEKSRFVSTHFVECVPLTNSSLERMMTSAGNVVATPSMVVSSIARNIRRRARSRVGAHTTNFAIKLS